MNSLWPAWKVALVAGVVAFFGLLVFGGLSGAMSTGNPEKAGEKLGQTYGWIVFLAPLIGYLVQKWRIDRHEETPR